MKGDNCDIRNCPSKTFDFGHTFYQLNKLELMNEKWKIQVIIYASVHKKVLMNGFIVWRLWVKDVLSDEVFFQYNRLINDDNRTANTILFNSLYDDEFFKLNVRNLFMLKAKDDFQHQLMTKVRF